MAQQTPPAARMSIDSAERAVNRAFTTGKVDRAAITRNAQLDAADAVAMAGVAMEADEKADEATKLAIIASGLGNRDRVREAKERERLARKVAKADHRAATRSAKRAYDAIKFSDPTKLGLMRVVQVAFLAHIVTTLLVLILTSRDTVVYSSVNIIDWIMVVLEGVAFYFFVNRLKVARPFTIAIALFGLVARIVSRIVSGSFELVSLLTEDVFYLMLLVYFCFSSRVKAVLVNDFSSDQGIETGKDYVIERSGWPFVRNLLIYFVVFSVLGHWMEAGMCQFIRLGWVQGEYDPSNTMLWRDWLYPYPMEGAAVVFIALFLYPLFINLKKRFKVKWVPYALSFVANALTCTVIEFFSGLVFNANLQNWDYTDNFCNIMGQVCLQNTIAFGIAASLIAWYVYPALERLIARVRPAVMNIVCVIVVIAGGILFSLYAISPPDGIDLGQRSAAVAEQNVRAERTRLYNSNTEIGGDAKDLKDELDHATSVPKDARDRIEQHIETIHTEVGGIQQELETLNKANGK